MSNYATFYKESYQNFPNIISDFSGMSKALTSPKVIHQSEVFSEYDYTPNNFIKTPKKPIYIINNSQYHKDGEKAEESETENIEFFHDDSELIPFSQPEEFQQVSMNQKMSIAHEDNTKNLQIPKEKDPNLGSSVNQKQDVIFEPFNPNISGIRFTNHLSNINQVTDDSFQRVKSAFLESGISLIDKLHYSKQEPKEYEHNDSNIKKSIEDIKEDYGIYQKINLFGKKVQSLGQIYNQDIGQTIGIESANDTEIYDSNDKEDLIATCVSVIEDSEHDMKKFDKKAIVINHQIDQNNQNQNEDQQEPDSENLEIQIVEQQQKPVFEENPNKNIAAYDSKKALLTFSNLDQTQSYLSYEERILEMNLSYEEKILDNKRALLQNLDSNFESFGNSSEQDLQKEMVRKELAIKIRQDIHKKEQQRTQQEELLSKSSKAKFEATIASDTCPSDLNYLNQQSIEFENIGIGELNSCSNTHAYNQNHQGFDERQETVDSLVDTRKVRKIDFIQKNKHMKSPNNQKNQYSQMSPRSDIKTNINNNSKIKYNNTPSKDKLNISITAETSPVNENKIIKKTQTPSSNKNEKLSSPSIYNTEHVEVKQTRGSKLREMMTRMEKRVKIRNKNQEESRPIPAILTNKKSSLMNYNSNNNTQRKVNNTINTGRNKNTDEEIEISFQLSPYNLDKFEICQIDEKLIKNDSPNSKSSADKKDRDFKFLIVKEFNQNCQVINNEDTGSHSGENDMHIPLFTSTHDNHYVLADNCHQQKEKSQQSHSQQTSTRDKIEPKINKAATLRLQQHQKKIEEKKKEIELEEMRRNRNKSNPVKKAKRIVESEVVFVAEDKEVLADDKQIPAEKKQQTDFRVPKIQGMNKIEPTTNITRSSDRKRINKGIDKINQPIKLIETERVLPRKIMTKTEHDKSEKQKKSRMEHASEQICIEKELKQVIKREKQIEHEQQKLDSDNNPITKTEGNQMQKFEAKEAQLIQQLHNFTSKPATTTPTETDNKEKSNPRINKKMKAVEDVRKIINEKNFAEPDKLTHTITDHDYNTKSSHKKTPIKKEAITISKKPTKVVMKKKITDEVIDLTKPDKTCEESHSHRKLTDKEKLDSLKKQEDQDLKRLQEFQKKKASTKEASDRQKDPDFQKNLEKEDNKNLENPLNKEHVEAIEEQQISLESEIDKEKEEDNCKKKRVEEIRIKKFKEQEMLKREADLKKKALEEQKLQDRFSRERKEAERFKKEKEDRLKKYNDNKLRKEKELADCKIQEIEAEKHFEVVNKLEDEKTKNDIDDFDKVKIELDRIEKEDKAKNHSKVEDLKAMSIQFVKSDHKKSTKKNSKEEKLCQDSQCQSSGVAPLQNEQAVLENLANQLKKIKKMKEQVIMEQIRLEQELGSDLLLDDCKSGQKSSKRNLEDNNRIIKGQNKEDISGGEAFNFADSSEYVYSSVDRLFSKKNSPTQENNTMYIEEEQQQAIDTNFLPQMQKLILNNNLNENQITNVSILVQEPEVTNFIENIVTNIGITSDEIPINSVEKSSSIDKKIIENTQIQQQNSMTQHSATQPASKMDTKIFSELLDEVQIIDGDNASKSGIEDISEVDKDKSKDLRSESNKNDTIMQMLEFSKDTVSGNDTKEDQQRHLIYIFENQENINCNINNDIQVCTFDLSKETSEKSKTYFSRRTDQSRSVSKHKSEKTPKKKKESNECFLLDGNIKSEEKSNRVQKCANYIDIEDMDFIQQNNNEEQLNCRVSKLKTKMEHIANSIRPSSEKYNRKYEPNLDDNDDKSQTTVGKLKFAKMDKKEATDQKKGWRYYPTRKIEFYDERENLRMNQSNNNKKKDIQSKQKKQSPDSTKSPVSIKQDLVNIKPVLFDSFNEIHDKLSPGRCEKIEVLQHSPGRRKQDELDTDDYDQRFLGNFESKPEIDDDLNQKPQVPMIRKPSVDFHYVKDLNVPKTDQESGFNSHRSKNDLSQASHYNSKNFIGNIDTPNDLDQLHLFAPEPVFDELQPEAVETKIEIKPIRCENLAEKNKSTPAKPLATREKNFYTPRHNNPKTTFGTTGGKNKSSVPTTSKRPYSYNRKKSSSKNIVFDYMNNYTGFDNSALDSKRFYQTMPLINNTLDDNSKKGDQNSINIIKPIDDQIEETKNSIKAIERTSIGKPTSFKKRYLDQKNKDLEENLFSQTGKRKDKAIAGTSSIFKTPNRQQNRSTNQEKKQKENAKEDLPPMQNSVQCVLENCEMKNDTNRQNYGTYDDYSLNNKKNTNQKKNRNKSSKAKLSKTIEKIAKLQTPKANNKKNVNQANHNQPDIEILNPIIASKQYITEGGNHITELLNPFNREESSKDQIKIVRTVENPLYKEEYEPFQNSKGSGSLEFKTITDTSIYSETRHQRHNGNQDNDMHYNIVKRNSLAGNQSKKLNRNLLDKLIANQVGRNDNYADDDFGCQYHYENIKNKRDIKKSDLMNMMGDRIENVIHQVQEEEGFSSGGDDKVKDENTRGQESGFQGSSPGMECYLDEKFMNKKRKLSRNNIDELMKDRFHKTNSHIF